MFILVVMYFYVKVTPTQQFAYWDCASIHNYAFCMNG